ncbi:hypothetical protein [Mesorhizobium sp. M0435]|uniref:hypothetical protein n=1 Tax=Mesorhizobium sp. M0435 TaxID=2956944 RepID=UPI0033350531
MKSFKDAIKNAEASGTVRLLSVRYDFPTAWAAYKATPVEEGKRPELLLDLTSAHYPTGRRAG